MIFGKHINRYYLRFLPLILPGLAALVVVDWIQLLIPSLYRMVINGMNTGFVTLEGAQYVFDMTFLLDHVCLPCWASSPVWWWDGFCGGCASWAPPF